jgi:hypothetical protein
MQATFVVATAPDANIHRTLAASKMQQTIIAIPRHGGLGSIGSAIIRKTTPANVVSDNNAAFQNNVGGVGAHTVGDVAAYHARCEHRKTSRVCSDAATSVFAEMRAYSSDSAAAMG